MDSPLLCDCTYHTRNIEHWGNDMLYDWIPGTENRDLSHET